MEKVRHRGMVANDSDDVSFPRSVCPEEGAITCCDPDNPECVGIPEYVAASTEALRSREPECTAPVCNCRQLDPGEW